MLGRTARTLCAFGLVAGAISGCGEDGSETAGLASLAPPDAPLYAEATIRPDAEQADAIESFADRVGGVSDPGGTLVPLIDEFMAATGVEATYADDLEPWLGDRAAVFVSSFEPTGSAGGSPDAALLVETDDAEAARDFLAKVIDSTPEEEAENSYEGTDYYSSSSGGVAAGIIDDAALVVGTENAFRVAVDSAEGEDLAASSEYTERADALPDDTLATAFFEPGETIEAVLASEGADPGTPRMWAPLLDGPLAEPLAIALTATPDAASVDVASMARSGALPTADPSLVEDLPAGSWLAVAVPDLGDTLAHGFDQLSGLPGAAELEDRVREMTGLDLDEDVLSWLGDAAGFVAGTTGPGFSLGLIAETSDAEAPRALIAALRRLAGVEADVVDDTFVAVRGTTVEAALDPADRLGADPAFLAAAEALGDFPAGLYLDLPSFFDVAEQGSDGDVDYDALKPYVAPLASLVAGSRVEGDLVLSRLTVTLSGAGG